jgi:hypothetical protein
MLCDNCQLHFDFSHHDYSHIKAETILSLRNHGADSSLLELLEKDLKRYQAARQLSQSTDRVDVFPWLQPDTLLLGLTDEALKDIPETELEIWRSGSWSNATLKNAAVKGCELCLRIAEVIQCLGFLPDLVDIESWLVLKPVTMRPFKIKFRISEEDVEWEWVELDIVERGSHNG